MKRYQKKVEELEAQNKALQKENEDLKFSIANLSTNSSESAQKLKEHYIHKLNGLEEQLLELTRKLNSKSQFSSQKPRGDETTKGLQTMISRIKAQKVELQRKIKEESMQFRLCNALLEKEILQLKKDAWRKDYEMKGLLASNQRLKKVSQRKMEEATVSTKRLKGLLQSRKAFSRLTSKNTKNIAAKPLMRGAGHVPEVKAQMYGVHSEYEQKSEELAMMAKEVMELKKEADILRQNNMKCILEDIEVDCQKKDLEIGNLIHEIKTDRWHKDREIKNLKEQVAKLNILLGQLEIQKPEFMHTEKQQNSTPVKSSSTVNAAISAESKSYISTNTDLSESLEVNISTSELLCCSCSKKSLCKTTKCSCRSAGGTCGASCGCASTKCSNREAITIKKMDSNSPQNSSSTNSLVAQGAMLLHTALIEKPVVPKRKPLSDIKNTLINVNAPKPSRKKKTDI